MSRSIALPVQMKLDLVLALVKLVDRTYSCMVTIMADIIYFLLIVFHFLVVVILDRGVFLAAPFC